MTRSFNNWCYWLALIILVTPTHSNVMHAGDVLFAAIIGYLMCKEDSK